MSKEIFVSYTTPDARIANDVVSFFEEQGISCFIAPRDVNPGKPYAANLMHAIESCRAVVLIASDAVNASEHVLNEIDLAFQNITQGTKIKPLRIDNALFTAAFKYYLSRQHWMDATIPPLEQRLNEFVSELLNQNT